ncbi:MULTISPECIES: hypothetical protein [unclassified Microcoleus]|uniref:hypothetical protein n=1 Tax=unclassified Microcoleus TaxID=2642155 RepID=UPI0025F4793D|nr:MULTISPECIES: hypothetical protein [unclassified Microcoleus]
MIVLPFCCIGRSPCTPDRPTRAPQLHPVVPFNIGSQNQYRYRTDSQPRSHYLPSQSKIPNLKSQIDRLALLY